MHPGAVRCRRLLVTLESPALTSAIMESRAPTLRQPRAAGREAGGDSAAPGVAPSVVGNATGVGDCKVACNGLRATRNRRLPSNRIRRVAPGTVRPIVIGPEL